MAFIGPQDSILCKSFNDFSTLFKSDSCNLQTVHIQREILHMKLGNEKNVFSLPEDYLLVIYLSFFEVYPSLSRIWICACYQKKLLYGVKF